MHSKRFETALPSVECLQVTRLDYPFCLSKAAISVTGRC
jgi:hypothetical protein